MQYVSTRGAAPKLGFEEAMLAGLARDGGLYVPETWPRMTEAEIAALAGLSYEEAAFRVMRPFVGDAFGEAEFRGDHRARLCRLRPCRAGAAACRSGRTTGCSSSSTGRRWRSRTWRCS